jgi:hypothetical protein
MSGRGATTSTSFAVSGSPAPPVNTLTDTSCSPTDFIEVSEKTTRKHIFFTLDQLTGKGKLDIAQVFPLDRNFKCGHEQAWVRIDPSFFFIPFKCVSKDEQ